MNNEIGRKITSLTLMTIMLAGGMTIAAQMAEADNAAGTANADEEATEIVLSLAF